MYRWVLLTCFIYLYSFLNAYNDVSKVESCLAEDELCVCLKEFHHTEILSERALSIYFSVGYNCEDYSIEQKMDQLKKARMVWDSIGYKGYRYLNSYYIIVDYYKSEHPDIDSIQKYTDVILSFDHDESDYSIFYYHKAKLDYINSFSKYGDSYYAFDLYDEYVNSNEFFRLSSIDQATTYASLISATGNIYNDVYINDALFLIGDVRIFIDSIQRHTSLDRSENEYLNKLKEYLQYAEAYCKDKKRDYDSALAGYQDYFNSLSFREDLISPAVAANSIATMYLNLGDYPLTKVWANKSIELFNKQNDTSYNYIPFLVIGQAYQELSMPDSAVWYLSIGLKKSLNKVLMDKRFDKDDLLDMRSPEYVIRYLIELLSIDLELLGDENERHSFERKKERIASFLQLIESYHEDWLSIYNIKRIANEYFEVISLFDLKHSNAEEFFWNSNSIKSSYYNKKDGKGEEANCMSFISERHEAVVQFSEVGNYLYSLVYYESAYTMRKVLHLDSLNSLRMSYLACIRDQCSSYDELSKPFQVVVPIEFMNVNNVLIIPSAGIADLPLEYFFRQGIGDKINVAISPFLKSPSQNDYFYSYDISAYLDSFTTKTELLRGRETIELDVLKGVKLESTYLKDLDSSVKGLASKDDFYSKALRGRIFHFSGHYFFDSIYPNKSALILRNDSKVEFVTLDDISKMTSHNKLVILNACQTGKGQLLSHEGVLSLGTSFLNSGAEAVVSTLWPVNDRAAAILMTYFYKELKKGKRKDEALRQAKLTYLAQADPEYQHPYYWAAFVAMGDMSPLFDPYKKWKIGGGVLSLLLISGLGFRKFSSKKVAA